MITAPTPPDEAERLADLHALQILDTPAEERFDRIVGLAASVFDVPIAYIAMIGADRQWFKAQCGLRVDETGREVSFCSHTILQHEALVVPDATLDERFRDNPLVVGDPYIRFYAGYPLRGPGGRNVGTLCLADRRPRSLSGRQVGILRQLATLAEHELRMVDLIEVQRQLLETRRQLAEDLAQAAEYVQALLPPPLAGPVATDWRFLASSQLGGDLFGYHWLDDRHLALYLLDVCGHGVGAALMSIAIHSALRSETLPATDFGRPSEVLAGLNRAFPMQDHQNKFFTIWYGVYDRDTRDLHYATAGHAPALLFDPSDDGPVKLGAPSLMIGVEPDSVYDSHHQAITPGSRLYLFSDGVFEVHLAAKEDSDRMLGMHGLSDVLARASAGGGSRVANALREIEWLQGSAKFADDFSLVEFEFQ